METNVQDFFTTIQDSVNTITSVILGTIETIVAYFEPKFIATMGYDSNGVYYISANSQFELDILMFQRKLQS